MSTLYRKYRPQTFADIIGQEHIIKTITNEIATNKIAHAYLFSGPRGVGKTTVARLLAKAVNCSKRKEGNSEPCNECSSCREISDGHNIDMFEMDAATHTQVEKVRENIIENINFRPTSSKYKIFLIDEVHMLSGGSFNALLKTLEEPPAHVIFILATTELHKLPATVISRCQRFTFKKIGFDLMLKRLKTICEAEEVKVDKEVLQKIIAKSDGCARDAESLLGQVLSLNLKKISLDDAAIILPSSSFQQVIELLELLTQNKTSEALQFLQKLLAEGINLDQFAQDLVETLRQLMLLQAVNNTDYLNVEYDDETKKQLKKLSSALTPITLITAIESLLKRRIEIKSSPIPQLPLELFIIEFNCHSDRSPDSHRDGVEESRRPTVISTPIRQLADEGEKSLSQSPTHHSITQTIKSVITNITHSAAPAAPKTTLDEAKQKWPELINRLNIANPSSVLILKMCSLVSMDAYGLHLNIAYKFHKDKFEEKKTKKLIEDIFAELCGEHINITCDLNATAPAEQKTSDADVASLALDFGGEVVA